MTTPDELLRANLERAFNEPDAQKRLEVIRELYAPDAVVHDREGSVVGHEAINALITRLMPTLPAGLAFVPDGPAMAHHGLGVMRWHTSPPMLNGFDVAQFREQRIAVLHVFIS
jgi:SnoaL-like domain